MGQAREVYRRLGASSFRVAPVAYATTPRSRLQADAHPPGCSKANPAQLGIPRPGYRYRGHGANGQAASLERLSGQCTVLLVRLFLVSAAGPVDTGHRNDIHHPSRCYQQHPSLCSQVRLFPSALSGSRLPRRGQGAHTLTLTPQTP